MVLAEARATRSIALAATSVASEPARPSVRGKFLAVGEQKLYLRGVTYGTFRPDPAGDQFPPPDVVERDFGLMADSGVNAVRVYTVPPTWFLDLAGAHGLHVMVGLPWEQHIAFLDDPGRARSIEGRVRDGVRRCAGHPAVLCYAIGNEIPASIVRWHGKRRVERFLERLCRAVRSEDPGALVTYVNFPSTEYLDLPFVDFVSFNVYLESRDKFEAYFARLQNLAGDRPLVLAEIGLDSRRNGEATQASALDWQVRSAFAAGCAGTFVFAWTDDWHRGGHEIEDWDFGLTDRLRRPKPALDALRRAFADVPFAADREWPRVSVVVCSHNGARTIADCLEGLSRLDYPDVEVIVVDDGSTDNTAALAREYDVRVIRTRNQGLGSARNEGAAAATGEIVAYLDDDARPDSHWLLYLADTFIRTSHAAVGGPNIAPPEDGLIAECVANAPGGPVHVLVDDEVAEHIPGCNFAVRKECLDAIGGWDPRFRAAGDDVDLCWRLQERGWTAGFNPAAMVWHHRRSSLRAYWRQQRGYGRAEALLEAKWPEKYNAVGHITWVGRLYGPGLTRALGLGQGRVYHGVWGSAAFQSLYQPAVGTLRSLPLMPEWYLLVALLALLTAGSASSTAAILLVPLLCLAGAASLGQALVSATAAPFRYRPAPLRTRMMLLALTATLHLAQPLARLSGRFRLGLTPWRRRQARFGLPGPHSASIWCEQWQSPEERVEQIERLLRQDGALVWRGGHFDRWDLEVRGGLGGAARTRVAVEEHGAGRQLIRLRSWPRPSLSVLVSLACLALIGIEAAVEGRWAAAAALGSGVLAGGGYVLLDCRSAVSAMQRVIADLPTAPEA